MAKVTIVIEDVGLGGVKMTPHGLDFIEKKQLPTLGQCFAFVALQVLQGQLKIARMLSERVRFIHEAQEDGLTDDDFDDSGDDDADDDADDGEPGDAGDDRGDA